jgi:hypothetical protein
MRLSFPNSQSKLHEPKETNGESRSLACWQVIVHRGPVEVKMLDAHALHLLELDVQS